MMDSFGLVTLFRFRNASAPCTLHWLPEKAAPGSESIRVGGACDVRITPTADWYVDFEEPDPEACVVRLPDVYTNWTRHGTFTPHQLFHSPVASAWLPADATLGSVEATYRAVAHDTFSSAHQFLRSERTLVGVHVRATDKLVERPGVEDEWFHSMAPFETTYERQRELESRAFQYIAAEMVGRRRKTRFFLGMDDEANYVRFAEHIVTASGAVVVNDDRRNVSILGDFFGLASCDVVVQVTRYSTFSMAASLVAGAPLVNLADSMRSNAEHIWIGTVMFDMPYKKF
jgi:hypothetical protein